MAPDDPSLGELLHKAQAELDVFRRKGEEVSGRTMEPVSGIIFELFRGSERHGSWIVACLEGAWPRLLGARLAGVCVPVEWERGRLMVEVRDRGWVDTLGAMKAELLERIRLATGGRVTQLEFRLTNRPA